ncbi:hypothetical protein [Saccharothrix australiensis]|uniref:Uncharacterized protein n=1 Tax=Saccharothrix australiensis TaxID=2072 RepID=A0A495W4C0_9PSEU|nr:hypothetical protein [Saccharothrix australiensis]RKT55503.1 hypothetical protein C8E97_4172 [Saccharothrix australiensis]
MWENEQQLRDALRTEVGGPAPAARTDLAEVLRRGRRGVLVRRAGAVVGVLVVVGVVGFGATTLGTFAGSSDPASGDTVPTSSARPHVWTTLNRAAQQPYGTYAPGASAPPPTDRQLQNTQLCSVVEDERSTEWLLPAPSPDVLRAWETAVGKAAAPAQAGPPRSHLFPADKEKNPASVDGHTHWIDVADQAGTGSVDLERGRTGLSPEAAADADLFAVGNCLPPRRAVRPNGVVLQLYEVRASEPFQSLTQALRVYAPSGDVYRITVRNFGSPDFHPRADHRAFQRTGPGRATLPLTEEALTRIGLAVADAL